MKILKEKSIEASIRWKISYLYEGMKWLQDSFKEFHEDITEYMAFSAEKYADHEKKPFCA
jgi:hypothetical protein